jgi:gliding motility-associated-like protein
MHSCSEDFGVPENVFGYQFANDGVAYTGVITFWETNTNYREYLGVELLSPLIANKEYYFSFFLSLGEDYQQYATKGLGLATSEFQVNQNNASALSGVNIVFQQEQFITDTHNWINVSGSFIAIGNESYLYIGNFSSEIDTLKVDASAMANYAYYFVDNVCLSEQPCVEPSIEIPNIFTPNEDEVNDYFITHDEGLIDKEMVILNRWGNVVFESNELDQWDGKDQKGRECSEGVYFVKVSYENSLKNTIETKTGFVHLIR